jgi:hypothetical protein
VPYKWYDHFKFMKDDYQNHRQLYTAMVGVQPAVCDTARLMNNCTMNASRSYRCTLWTRWLGT